MRKLITGGIAVALGASTAVAGGAFAGGNGAQRATLAPSGGSMTNCQSTSGGANGFAIVNGPGQPGAIKFVNGEVHLVGGAPGATYTITLGQSNGGTCTPAGTLTTNDQGIGNGHIDGMGTAGTYFVALFQGNNEEFASNTVTIN